MSEPLVLTLSCADRPGITARVTSFLFERGGNILEAQQFNDRSSDAFFMRVEFDPGEASREMIRTEFAPIASDAVGRMDMLALEAALGTGNVGTIVATMGTTGIGATDPLPEILALAKRYVARAGRSAPSFGGVHFKSQ